MRSFASDNYAPAHPAVLEAIAAANDGSAAAYGGDPRTERLHRRLAELFATEAAETALVFNGTGANVVAIRAGLRGAAGAVICTEMAHINVDEGGAPERVAGAKLFAAPSPDGKLRPADVERLCARIGDEHQAQPGLVSITQTTELGTLYRPEEIAAIADAAHAHGLHLHLDGARICHAAAALGLPFHAFTADVGVDIVSFGATKAGAIGAEAVIALAPDLAHGLPYLRKASMQLASKSRYLAAQFEALLDGERWRELSGHSNAMATRLARALGGIAGVRITQPVEANVVFAELDPRAIVRLQEQWAFYVWNPARNEVRWMCSWDTTESEVDDFAAAIGAAVEAVS